MCRHQMTAHIKTKKGKGKKMKKLFILAAAVVALASCGNKSGESTNNADSTAVANDSAAIAAATEATADSITSVLEQQLAANNGKDVATTLQNAQAYYEQLVKEGKTEEAIAYASKLKAYYEQKKQDIKKVASGNTTIDDLVNGIINLPTDAANTADAAKNAAVSDAASAVNGVKDAAKDVKNAAEATVKEGVEKVKNAPSEAKKKAEEKANEAVSNAKKEAKDQANKAVNNALNKVFGN